MAHGDRWMCDCGKQHRNTVARCKRCGQQRHEVGIVPAGIKIIEVTETHKECACPNCVRFRELFALPMEQIEAFRGQQLADFRFLAEIVQTHGRYVRSQS